MYKEKIIDLATGEEIFRDYTPEEIAEIEFNQAKVKAEIKAINKAQAEAIAAKAALLNRLGITAEEAALLLG